MDFMLEEFSNEMTAIGLDPHILPPKSHSFEKTTLFVRWHGSFKLYDGYVKGLSTIYRTNDASAQFVNDSLELVVNLGFDELEGGSSWSINFMNLEKTGGLHFQVDSVNLRLILVLSNATQPPEVTELSIDSLGQLTTDIDGLGSFDFLLEFLTNSFVNIFKVQLIELFQSDLRSLLNDHINKIKIPKHCQ